MKELIVGDKGCSFNEIVKTISRNDHNVLLLAKNWRKFARALDVAGSEVYELEQDLLLKRKRVMDVVAHLLENWRQAYDNEAKFSTLLDILEMECGWKDMAECLWKRFQKKMTEKITWADLDERSRNKVMESDVMFQGRLRNMRDLCSVFDESEVESVLKAALSGPTILQLLDCKVVSLTKDIMPEMPFYYIPRTLTSRQRIDPDIFKHTCSDMFLFQDISLSDLSGVAQNNPIAISSRQVEKVTSRFILMEFPEDFENITKLCKRTSVHWLKFKRGHFYWVKTCGSLNLIFEYIHQDQDELSEDEFLQELHTQYKRKLPVCIAGIPGMGKTCLLANLCQQRKACCDNKRLVLFISLPGFLKGVGDLFQEISKENICKWVANHMSQNEFGQEVVSKMLQSDHYQVEIYFDAFDEVPSHQLSFTKCLLECLTEKLGHVHITVTTGFHNRRELEETLHVLSYSLASFRNEIYI